MKQRALRSWMKQATPLEKRELAKLAKTSVENLYHVAAGRRGVSSTLAIRLEEASLALGGSMLKREELAAGCRACNFPSRCRR